MNDDFKFKKKMKAVLLNQFKLVKCCEFVITDTSNKKAGCLIKLNIRLFKINLNYFIIFLVVILLPLLILTIYTPSGASLISNNTFPFLPSKVKALPIT